MPKKPDRRQSVIRIDRLDREHYARTDRYARQVDKLYQEATREYSALAGTIFEPDPSRPFSFADYPETRKKAAEMAADLARSVERVIEAGQRSEWIAATYRANAYMGAIIDTSKLTPAELELYEDRNLEGLAAFQKRKVQGMNLSGRVWRITDQFKEQMELAIDTAIGEGKSAQELSRDIRQLLKEPNKLFRRVRDKYGNLQLSKAASAYHPGRGVYRSSYANAMRLARTEINMAYRTADWERWQREEFVVGFRISLSNNHTVKDSKGNDVPLHDICDELAGDYPKTFKFVGWHPNCRCTVTPILKSTDEMHRDRRDRLEAIMNDEEYMAQPSANEIKDLPQAFTQYIDRIAERSKGWASQPYWIRDNFKGGKIAGGLLPSVPHTRPVGGTKAKPDIPPTPCTEFDAWIDDLKQQAYALGLDVSRLDTLRAAGEREPLKAEVDRLRKLADERAEQWSNASEELSDFIRGCSGAPESFWNKFTKLWNDNFYNLSRYFQHCIEALKKAVTDAKKEWAEIKAEMKKTVKASPEAAKMFADQESELKRKNVEFNPIKPHAKEVSEADIIANVGGGDLTKGSCASLGLAFAANKAGYDVRDFRDGESRSHFASYGNLASIGKALGANPYSLVSGIDLMKTTKIGKLYYCVIGRHAAIVRQIANGKYEYLELQSPTSNGWKMLTAQVFARRFRAKGRGNIGFILDIDKFKDLPDFHKMMGYINTKNADQRKGDKGKTK